VRRQGLDPAELTPELRARIAARVAHVDGCWVYPITDVNGYGRVSIHQKPHYAHRLMYLLDRGAIPDGLQLDHLCRNRGCCNPDHLEAVTSRENTMRGDLPRIVRERGLSKTECVNGHPLSGLNVRVNAKGHRICRTCKREWFRRQSPPATTARGPWREVIRREGRRTFLVCGHVFDLPANYKFAPRHRCVPCDAPSLWPVGE